MQISEIIQSKTFFFFHIKINLRDMAVVNERDRMRYQIISKCLLSILKSYYGKYPSKRGELKEKIEDKIEEYIALAERVGGKVIRIFLDDIGSIISESEYEDFTLKQLEINTAFIIENLRIKFRELEKERLRLISRLISSKYHSMPRDWVEITKAKAEGYKRVARILSHPIESSDCPACLGSKKTKLLADKESKWFYCPQCNALYVKIEGELNFVHRLSDFELDLVFDEFAKSIER